MSGSAALPAPGRDWPRTGLHAAIDAVVPVAPATGLLRAATALGLAATLLLLPFGSLFLKLDVDSLRVTALEIVALATIALWSLQLALERRLPAVPRGAVLGLAVLAAVAFASSRQAQWFPAESLRFSLRSAIYWVLFLVAADQVRSERTAWRLLPWLLAGAAVSAFVGWLAAITGSIEGLPGASRLFTVGGLARIAGTFDYPTIAAMAWEASLLACLPLLYRRGSWAGRVAVLVGLVLVGGALPLTVSRGALLGLAAGLGVMLAVGVARFGRRAVALPLGAGLLVLAWAIVLQVGSGLPLSRVLAETDGSLYGATYAAPGRLTLAPGQHDAVRVDLANAGTATWRTEAPAWQLSYHWLDPRTHAILPPDGARTTLEGPVAPGERASLEADVVAPVTPGSYLLAWDMVQDGVTWFSEKSVPTAAMVVEVRAGAEPLTSGGDAQAAPLVLYPDLVRMPTRVELWGAALEMVAKRPLLGIGPGTFRLGYGAWLGWTRWDQGIHSNDLYLELAATTGLLGLAAFLLVLGAALWPQVRGVRRAAAPSDLPAVMLRAGFLAGAVAFLVHGTVDYFLGFSPTGMLFWVILGIGLGLGVSTLAAGRAGRPAGEAP